MEVGGQDDAGRHPLRDDARQRRRSRCRLLREILQLPTRLTIPGATRSNRWLRRRLGLASLLARARHVLAQHEHVVACEPFQLAELRRSRSVAAAVGQIGHAHHRPRLRRGKLARSPANTARPATYALVHVVEVSRWVVYIRMLPIHPRLFFS